MLSHETFQSLREVLAKDRADGCLSLREFGKLLGQAAGRWPYSKSYVSQLLRGKLPITP